MFVYCFRKINDREHEIKKGYHLFSMQFYDCIQLWDLMGIQNGMG